MKRRSFIKNISLAGMGLSGLNTMTGDNKRFENYISNRPPINDRTYTCLLYTSPSPRDS